MPENGDIFVTLFTEEQVKILQARAISPEVAAAAGVLSIRTASDLPEGCPDYWTTENGYLPGLLFRYQAPITGTVEYQLRPDTPVVKDDGSVAKYVFRKGAASIVHQAHRDVYGTAESVLLTEGTCQTIAAASVAPNGWDVYGIAGCQSWMKAGIPSADLAVVSGRDVLIALDADAATNRDVYDAGVRLRDECLVQGATSVKFLRTTGGAKSGLDDVLAGQLPERRTDYLAGLIKVALERPKIDKPEAPSRTMPSVRARTADPNSAKARFFGDDGLKVEALADAVEDSTPVALTAENKLAVYSHGVFRIADLALSAAVGDLLGDLFRPAHRATVEEFLAGRLDALGRVLPDRPTGRPMMNTASGMVVLKTGQIKEHDPRYLSKIQFPVQWDPNATCPTYERWITAQAGEQVDALEETISAVLDPTNTPQRAAYLFGKARSGKGTFLRLLLAIVGQENTSAVDLAMLSKDPFAAANVYGKALNVSGDLPAMHVDDVSMFKKLTGQDLIQANRKFGGQFPFINQALFVFAGNELPTVGESSRAYVERIRPFEFDATFAGKENPEIEKAMMNELPGILVRWVAAWRRRNERGSDLVISTPVQERFEVSSDRVRQFLANRCKVGEGFMTTTELYAAFKAWVADQGGSTLGKIKFAQRLEGVPGLEYARGHSRQRGWAVLMLPTHEWDMPSDRAEYNLVQPERAELRAEGRVSPIVEQSEKMDTSSVDHGETSVISNIGVIGPGLPGVPNSAHTTLDTPVRSPIDDLFAASADPTPRHCHDCGTAEVLIDWTWFACPVCYPATARTDQGN